MENDIILIYIEEEPVSFARIEEIRPDVRNNWFIIKLLILNIPPKPVSWILKADYINGDSFYMNGQMMRMEKVICPPDDYEWEDETPVESQRKTKEPQKTDKKSTVPGGQLISFAQHRRSKK